MVAVAPLVNVGKVNVGLLPLVLFLVLDDNVFGDNEIRPHAVFSASGLVPFRP
jgi:hypothetical protein